MLQSNDGAPVMSAAWMFDKMADEYKRQEETERIASGGAGGRAKKHDILRSVTKSMQSLTTKTATAGNRKSSPPTSQSFVYQGVPPTHAQPTHPTAMPVIAGARVPPPRPPPPKVGSTSAAPAPGPPPDTTPVAVAAGAPKPPPRRKRTAASVRTDTLVDLDEGATVRAESSASEAAPMPPSSGLGAIAVADSSPAPAGGRAAQGHLLDDLLAMPTSSERAPMTPVLQQTVAGPLGKANGPRGPPLSLSSAVSVPSSGKLWAHDDSEAISPARNGPSGDVYHTSDDASVISRPTGMGPPLPPPLWTTQAATAPRANRHLGEEPARATDFITLDSVRTASPRPAILRQLNVAYPPLIPTAPVCQAGELGDGNAATGGATSQAVSPAARATAVPDAAPLRSTGGQLAVVQPPTPLLPPPPAGTARAPPPTAPPLPTAAPSATSAGVTAGSDDGLHSNLLDAFDPLKRGTAGAARS